MSEDTLVEAGTEAARRTYALDRAHVFHTWSAQATLDPMVISAGQGSYLWDGDGARYLDFSSQLIYTNIGHQHPRVVEGIKGQADRLCALAPKYAQEARSEAARLIAEVMPEGIDKVFFTSGGADAVEHAVRMARVHTGRIKVLTQYRSYHGATHLTANLTGDPRRWASDYGTAGVARFWGPFLYRSPFHASSEEEECARALQHLEDTVVYEGSSTIAAIVLETIPGSAGILPPPPGYLAGVREICDRYGIVYIADEVMTGFGRTGRWLGLDHEGVTPDLVVFAKGVTSGYVPLGGVAISRTVAASFDHSPYPGGLTYSGHPLACAAAVATIEAMRDEGINEHADRVGREVIGPGLRALAHDHPCVGEVRGLATFWALELVVDRATREPMAPYAGESPVMASLESACLERGLIPFIGGNRIHVVPPCTVSDSEAAEGIAILDDVLRIADAHTRSG